MPLVRISHRSGVTDAHREAQSEDMLICLLENDLADGSFENGDTLYVR
jgi:hypothetical protein